MDYFKKFEELWQLIWKFLYETILQGWDKK